MATSISRTNKANPNKYRKKIPVLLRLEKDQNTKILLIEGESDLFYEKIFKEFLGNEAICLCPVTDSKEYNREDFKSEIFRKDAKKYVEAIVRKQLTKEKEAPAIKYGKCYGLIDRDFDFKEEEKKNYEGRLEFTDCNDLETTLLSFDYENIESKFKKDFNGEQHDGEGFNVLGKSIEYAAEIGKLRKLRENKRDKLKGKLTKNIILDFKSIENNTDAYSSLLDNNKYFNIHNYIGYSDKSAEVQSLMNEIAQFSETKLSYCRGHDIFNFVACFYKLDDRIHIERLDGRHGEIKVLEIRKDYEEQMENYFCLEKFKNTKIYSFFEKIVNQE